jgi:hypothetical protein
VPSLAEILAQADVQSSQRIGSAYAAFSVADILVNRVFAQRNRDPMKVSGG